MLTFIYILLCLVGSFVIGKIIGEKGGSIVDVILLGLLWGAILTLIYWFL